jgi:uncharacterized alkaline shock family protein YloU
VHERACVPGTQSPRAQPFRRKPPSKLAQMDVERTQLGTIRIGEEAIAQIVGHTTAESYGVVGMAGKGLKRLLTRDKLTQGIDVSGGKDGLRIDLHVVVEYGLNLAEVAATVRSRVTYEVERLTGLRVAAVEVHIEDVRRSA